MDKGGKKGGLGNIKNYYLSVKIPATHVSSLDTRRGRAGLGYILINKCFESFAPVRSRIIIFV